MKNVLLLLANGFEIYEASAFIDVIGWNSIEGDKTTKLFSCGIQKELTSTFNQKFIADYTVNEIDIKNFDALAIPGGFQEFGFYEDAYSIEYQHLIQSFYLQKKIIASICVGALPLAKSGILSNRNATTYDKNPQRISQLKSYNVKFVNQPIVISDNIITSWNPSTAIDVAFLLLEKLTSKENAENVKNLMGFITN